MELLREILPQAESEFGWTVHFIRQWRQLERDGRVPSAETYRQRLAEVVQGQNDAPSDGERIPSTVTVRRHYSRIAQLQEEHEAEQAAEAEEEPASDECTETMIRSARKAGRNRKVLVSDDEAEEDGVRADGFPGCDADDGACQLAGLLQSVQLDEDDSPSVEFGYDNPGFLEEGWTATHDDDVENKPPSPSPPLAKAQKPKTIAASSQRLQLAPADYTDSRKVFMARRDQLTRHVFLQVNEQVFGGRLDPQMRIDWNDRMRKAAGYTYYKIDQAQYVARIEMSSKVCDSFEKMRNTLIHEMCHCAVWCIDHMKGAHGSQFRRWGRRCTQRYPDIGEVTTCHSYTINHKFKYQCTNEACGKVFGRFSDSIDTDRHVCGACRSALVKLGQFRPDGTPAKKRAPSAYSLFVQSHFATVRRQHPSATHKEVMTLLSVRYRTEKHGPGN